MNDVTQILQAVAAGEHGAEQQLWATVYAELRMLAAAQVSNEKNGQTLSPTALVNEAYLRLGGGQSPSFANRRHFFAAAATAMRRILVDTARSKGRHRRGGNRTREYPDLDNLPTVGTEEEVLALHEALEQFAAVSPDKAKLVELRFFAGLTLPQAAECLGISPSTADRAWRYARAWLYTAMTDDKKIPDL